VVGGGAGISAGQQVAVAIQSSIPVATGWQATAIQLGNTSNGGAGSQGKPDGVPWQLTVYAICVEPN
jgi:hypothetical protein